MATNAEGAGLFWYRRDPKQVRSKLIDATKLHARLLKEWPTLRERYRNASASVASYEAWAETFAKHTESELKR